MSKFSKEVRENWPAGCGIAFFVFAVLFNIAWISLIVWLIIEVIQWIGRH
jgi:hypothetical protein